MELGGALRICGGAEDRALVVLRNLGPALDIGGVIAAGLRRQGKIGAWERRARLGNHFRAGVAFTVPFLAPEFAAEAFWVLRPVGQFVGKRGIWAADALEMLTPNPPKLV